MDVLHAVFIKDLIGRDNYRGLMILNDALWIIARIIEYHIAYLI